MISVLKSKQAHMSRQQGLSLVELMVALVIALILTAGVIQIFLGSNQTYRVNEGMSRVQENVRFGMDVLQRDIRMAGFTGCSTNIMNHLNPGNAGYQESLMGGIAVVGWEFTGTSPGQTYQIDGVAGTWASTSANALPADVAADALPGSDIIIMNRAERQNVSLNGNPAPNASTINVTGSSGLDQGSLVMVVSDNCAAGDLFQMTNSSSGTITKGASGLNQSPGQNFLGTPYNDNASIFTWASYAFYIGENPAGEPALYRRRLDTGGNVGELLELVESVENMQILYGVDTSGNQRVDRYVTAAAVTDWEQVISVRLALLLRTANQPSPETDSRSYTLIGTVVDPVDDRRLRQVSTTTIGVRNRLD